MTSELDKLVKSMQEAISEYVVPGEQLTPQLFSWYMSANASGLCNLRPQYGQVCMVKGCVKIGARHIAPTECLHLAGRIYYLCHTHIALALAPDPWVCSQCGARAAFSEPVEI